MNEASQTRKDFPLFVQFFNLTFQAKSTTKQRLEFAFYRARFDSFKFAFGSYEALDHFPEAAIELNLEFLPYSVAADSRGD
jgi:hypothetical protein